MFRYSFKILPDGFKLIRLYPCGSFGQSISFVFGARVGHFAATPQSDVVGIWSRDLGVMATPSVRQKMPFIRAFITRFGSPFTSKVVVCAHCLVTLSLTINEILNWLSSLPTLMKKSFWWWLISLFPYLHTPSPFSRSLISLVVSVDVKHHVHILTCGAAAVQV